jgi:hypothetical protein
MRKIALAMVLGLSVGGVGLNVMAEDKATTTAAAVPAPSAVEQKLIDEVTKLGGTVTHDEKAAGNPVIMVNLRDTEATDKTLELVKEVKTVTHLDLANTKVTDKGIDVILGLPELVNLELGFTELTDAGLKKIEALKKLTLLGISRTKVTKKGHDEAQAALPKCQIDWIFDHPEEEPKKEEMK